MASTYLVRTLFAALSLSALAAGAVPGRAVAQQPPAALRTLTLRAVGTASTAPDLAWLRLGVDTQAKDAKDALRANAAAMTKVVAALKSDGVADKDVQTSNLFIAPLYSEDPKKAKVIIGYRVGNRVSVGIRDLARIGAILDEVVALGSNDVAALSFDVNDPSAVENAARQAAVRDAIAKAKLYASAAGVELGPILTITEEPSGTLTSAARRYAPAAAASPVEAGELTFHANIDVTWRLQ